MPRKCQNFCLRNLAIRVLLISLRRGGISNCLPQRAISQNFLA